ncbi:MAG: sugar ABC transporter substrate-binding protein [Lawsonibacter sp.]|nr:sugar ABC transporter substrate-binding protein [Lawsonibacter sp.]
MRERKSKVIEIVLLGVLGALALLCLAAPQLFRDRKQLQLLSISVLLRDTDTSGWTVARQGMEQAADELDAELRFLTLTTYSDGAEQEELLLRELDGGADGLVLVPADPIALPAALLQRTNTCPVVTLESAMDGSAGTVSPDNVQLGRQLAQALLEDWDGGTVLLVNSAPGCTGVTERIQAAQQTLEGENVPTKRVRDLPQSGPEERWVMTFDASSTQHTAERKVTEEFSFALYGVGSSTAITAQLEQGTISAVAAWSDYAAGYLAVRQTVEQVRGTGEELAPLPFSILRKEDIYAPENQKLLFPIMSSSGR